MAATTRHLSDHELLLELEGELSREQAGRVREHLNDCWPCRARRGELEQTIASVTRACQSAYEPRERETVMARARLRAALSEAARPRTVTGWFHVPRWGPAAAAGALLAAVLLAIPFLRSVWWRPETRPAAVAIPDPRLTPGAALLVTRQELCAQRGENNRAVPIAIERRVLAEYGIRQASTEGYEVDYLITPALGGADDIRNLWPHSYSTPLWNAWVKDALEDRLRELVCSGALDLRQAQDEIAANWIEAYKKYFNTQAPLPEHLVARREADSY